VKNKLRPPPPGTVIALLALFITFGGTAYGLAKNSIRSNDIAPNAVRASDLGPMKLRAGKIRDFDQTAGDGEFSFAGGRARCKRGEQLISGGLRYRRPPSKDRSDQQWSNPDPSQERANGPSPCTPTSEVEHASSSSSLRTAYPGRLGICQPADAANIKLTITTETVLRASCLPLILKSPL
jgi:hypothetical protein